MYLPKMHKSVLFYDFVLQLIPFKSGFYFTKIPPFINVRILFKSTAYLLIRIINQIN